MSSDFVELLRDDFSAELKDSDPHTVINAYEEERHAAADRIEALERLEKQMPAIIEYLESQADVVDGDNGIPHPNKAMTLLVWLRHEMEKID